MEAERKVPRSDGPDGVKQQVIKERWTDFRFDQPLEESLFSFEIPNGFAVETRQASAVAASARDEERRAMEAQKAAQEAALKAKADRK